MAEFNIYYQCQNSDYLPGSYWHDTLCSTFQINQILDVAELPTDAITGGVNNQVKEKIAALEAKVNEIVKIENLSNC